MAVIDSTRRLLGSFRSRNVVYTSKAFVNTTHVMLVQFELDFGAAGAIRRRCMLEFKSIQGTFDKTVFDQCYSESSSRLITHLHRMNRLREVFGKALEWIDSNETGHAVSYDAGDDPFFIHTVRKNKDVLIEIFGRGINGLNLGIEGKTTQGRAECINRINEIVRCIDEHLEMVRNINLSETMLK